jgi:hypothetical protein
VRNAGSILQRDIDVIIFVEIEVTHCSMPPLCNMPITAIAVRPFQLKIKVLRAHSKKSASGAT